MDATQGKGMCARLKAALTECLGSRLGIAIRSLTRTFWRIFTWNNERTRGADASVRYVKFHCEAPMHIYLAVKNLFSAECTCVYSMHAR